MNIRSADLQKLLDRFSGHLIQEPESTPYHRFALRLFTDPKIISNPRIEITAQLDITEIYQNFKDNYRNKSTPPATLTAFIKWLLLKSMHSTPFNWRYINNQWYGFENLPLFIVVRTFDERVLESSFLFDVANSSWEDFSKKHSSINLDINETDEFKNIMYLVSNQIERLHIPRMSSYRTSIKTLDNESHRPSIVVSDPYFSEKRLYLPIHLSISHAPLVPMLVEDFLKKFTILANKTPEEVEAEYKSNPAPFKQARL